MRAKDIERFWSKVKRVDGDGCWEWQGTIKARGYGQMTFFVNGEKRDRLAHRVAWEIANDGIPPRGLVVMHHCDNKRCVRPDHLELATHGENMADARLKGRFNGGAGRGRPTMRGRPGNTRQVHGAPLTVDEVRDIRRRRAARESLRSIAALFGVSPTAVLMVERREIYAWLDPPSETLADTTATAAGA